MVRPTLCLRPLLKLHLRFSTNNDPFTGFKIKTQVFCLAYTQTFIRCFLRLTQKPITMCFNGSHKTFNYVFWWLTQKLKTQVFLRLTLKPFTKMKIKIENIFPTHSQSFRIITKELKELRTHKYCENKNMWIFDDFGAWWWFKVVSCLTKVFGSPYFMLFEVPSVYI